MFPLYDNIRGRQFPFFTILLIALNIWTFVVWQLHDGIRLTALAGGLIPRALTDPDVHGAWLRLGSYMFLHGGWLHLLGNMWFLWIFGRRVEEAIGSGAFLGFYLVSGILAGLCHAYFASRSLTPLVGASGAISGVLGAYLVLFPRARIMTLVPIVIFIRVIAVPAVIFLLIWIGLQVVSQALTPARQVTGVAYFAHIGGFLSGLLLMPLVRGSSRATYVEEAWR